MGKGKADRKVGDGRTAKRSAGARPEAGLPMVAKAVDVAPQGDAPQRATAPTGMPTEGAPRRRVASRRQRGPAGDGVRDGAGSAAGAEGAPASDDLPPGGTSAGDRPGAPLASLMDAAEEMAWSDVTALAALASRFEEFEARPDVDEAAALDFVMGAEATDSASGRVVRGMRRLLVAMRRCLDEGVPTRAIAMRLKEVAIAAGRGTHAPPAPNGVMEAFELAVATPGEEPSPQRLTRMREGALAYADAAGEVRGTTPEEMGGPIDDDLPPDDAGTGPARKGPTGTTMPLMADVAPGGVMDDDIPADHVTPSRESQATRDDDDEEVEVDRMRFAVRAGPVEQAAIRTLMARMWASGDAVPAFALGATVASAVVEMTVLPSLDHALTALASAPVAAIAAMEANDLSAPAEGPAIAGWMLSTYEGLAESPDGAGGREAAYILEIMATLARTARGDGIRPDWGPQVEEGADFAERIATRQGESRASNALPPLDDVQAARFAATVRGAAALLEVVGLPSTSSAVLCELDRVAAGLAPGADAEHRRWASREMTGWIRTWNVEDVELHR